MRANGKTKRLLLLSAVFVLTNIWVYADAAGNSTVELNNAQRIHKELYNSDGRVLVVAHRGDWKNAPENSIPAIQSCIEKGVDIVEVDVRKTKDGNLVLMHDKAVNRTTDGNGLVSELTLNEIKKLHLKDCHGVITQYKVPTLKEVMLVAKDKCMVNLDKIDDIMPEALGVLKKTSTVKYAIFKSDRAPNKINDFIELLDTPIIYIHIIRCKGGFPTEEELFATINRLSIRPIAIEIVFDNDKHHIISADAISAIKSRGMRVWVNTLDNTPWESLSGGHVDPLSGENPDNSWGWLLDRGVNIIQTNEPFWLIKYLRARSK